MPDDDKQVEIEVALRDTASQTLRGISREIDNITRKLLEAGRRGSDAFENIKRKGSEAGQSSDKAAKGVDNFTKSIGGLAKSLAGPLGLAAAFYGVSKSLSSFVQSKAELSLLTTDLGITMTRIGEVKQILMRKGFPEEFAKKFLTGILGQLQDARVRGDYSDFYKKLARYGDEELTASVMELLKSGRVEEVFEKLIDHAQKMLADPRRETRGRYFATEVLNQPPSAFTNWSKFSKDLIKSTKTDLEQIEKYRKDEVDFYQRAANLKVQSIQKVLEWLNLLTDKYKETTPHGAPTTPGTSGGTTFDKMFDERGGNSFGPGGTGPEIIVNPKSLGPRSDLGGATDFSSSNRRVAHTYLDEIESTEKESNQTLITIRDVLKAVYGPTGAPPPASNAGRLGPGGPIPAGNAGSSRFGGGGLADVGGKPVDPQTVTELRALASTGDTAGMQNLMRSKGYMVNSKWCGDLTRTLVTGSGFGANIKKGSSIASTWRQFGENIDPSGVNVAGRPFGSMIASKTNVPIGSTGGHVMTPVPGTYNPKDNTVEVIDTRGRRRRSAAGFEFRYVGDTAVAAAKAGQPTAPGMPAPATAAAAAALRGGGYGRGSRGDPRGLGGFIRETAAKYGIDPDVAMRVAASEGLSTFQSTVKRSGKGSYGGREDSWGAFQLYMGGGLGNKFVEAFPGVDPRDPKNEKLLIDFALKNAAKSGWGQWYGARKAGISPWQGINRQAIDRANKGSGRQSSSRDGRVRASVDFAAMKKVREAGEIFMPVRTAGFGQGTTVHRNANLPGSSDYTRWTA